MAYLYEYEAINTKALAGGFQGTYKRPYTGGGQSPFQRPPYEKWRGNH